MLLDRASFVSWREIQDAYLDYKASLGPWSEAQIVEYLQNDYGPDDSKWPFPRKAICDYFASALRILEC